MPMLLRSLSAMRRPQMNALLDELAGEGVRVMRADLPGDMDGAYMLRSNTILLDTGMTAWETLPVLLHEMIHWRRGDDGPQSTCVERSIDEAVALQLIDPSDYASAEMEYGWHTGGIAVELDVPRWVVEAYRRVLSAELEHLSRRGQVPPGRVHRNMDVGLGAEDRSVPHDHCDDVIGDAAGA